MNLRPLAVLFGLGRHADADSPTFSLEDLVYDGGEYSWHAATAIDSVKRAALESGADSASIAVNAALADAKVKHLRTAEEWIGGEFVPKIRDFSSGRKWLDSRSHVRIDAQGSDRLARAARHAELAKGHGESVVEELRFFIGDPRSPFDVGRSFDGGGRSACEVSGWYANGLDIVRRNIARVAAALDDGLSFVMDRRRGKGA